MKGFVTGRRARTRISECPISASMHPRRGTIPSSSTLIRGFRSTSAAPCLGPFGKRRQPARGRLSRPQRLATPAVVSSRRVRGSLQGAVVRDFQEQIIRELHVSPWMRRSWRGDRSAGLVPCRLHEPDRRARLRPRDQRPPRTRHLTGRLCRLATERLLARGRTSSSSRFTCRIPTQIDAEDARLALSLVREPQRSLTFDIARGVDGFVAEYRDALGEQMSDFTKGNAGSRGRHDRPVRHRRSATCARGWVPITRPRR